MAKAKREKEHTEEELTTVYEERPPQAGPPTLYDVSQPQTIPFTITRGGKSFRVSHTVQPPSNERFFQLQEDIDETLSRAKKASTLVFDPKLILWKEIVISRTGFVDRDDWKEATHPSDAVGVINAMLHIEVQAEEEQDVTNDDELLDDDALYVVAFNAQQGNALLTNLSHSFRQESKAEMDEYLAIISDQPSPNVMASAVKMSKAERYYRLGKKLLQGSTGYASDIPAWHLAFTVEVFLARQLGRMGKSFAA